MNITQKQLDKFTHSLAKELFEKQLKVVNNQWEDFSPCAIIEVRLKELLGLDPIAPIAEDITPLQATCHNNPNNTGPTLPATKKKLAIVD